MKLTEYKTQTLARADVDDIVKIEAVEKRPIKDATGRVTSYEQVVHTTEQGRKITKYDVHLMRDVDGVKQFSTESIAVVNEGAADEDVVRTSQTQAEKTKSAIEQFIDGQPGYHKQILQLDVDAPSATFTALVPQGDGTVKNVTYLAYREGGKNKIEEITNP